MATSLKKMTPLPQSPLTASSSSGRGGGLESPTFILDEMFPGLVIRKGFSDSVIRLPYPLCLPNKGFLSLRRDQISTHTPRHWGTPQCALLPAHPL